MTQMAKAGKRENSVQRPHLVLLVASVEIQHNLSFSFFFFPFFYHCGRYFQFSRTGNTVCNDRSSSTLLLSRPLLRTAVWATSIILEPTSRVCYCNPLHPHIIIIHARVIFPNINSFLRLLKKVELFA